MGRKKNRNNRSVTKGLQNNASVLENVNTSSEDSNSDISIDLEDKKIEDENINIDTNTESNSEESLVLDSEADSILADTKAEELELNEAVLENQQASKDENPNSDEVNETSLFEEEAYDCENYDNASLDNPDDVYYEEHELAPEAEYYEEGPFVSENSVYEDSEYDSAYENSIFESVTADSEKKKKKKGSNNNETTFGGFLKEYFAHIKERFSKNRKIVVIVVGLVAVIGVISLIVHSIGSKPKEPQTISDAVVDTASASDNLLSVPTDPYEVDAYPDVNVLISSYYMSKQNDDIDNLKKISPDIDAVETAKIDVLSKYITEYKLKNCYTKKGPYDNSYLVYAVFDVKMEGYDVLAPGLQTFVVCSNDDGSLYIYSGDFETKVADYISQVSAQDDVVELMNRISVEYNDILASNQEFSDYMNTFKGSIKTEIGEKIAAIEVSMNSTDDNSSDDSASSNDTDSAASSNEAVSNNETPATFTVKTTTSVNIRKSDSENADKLDTVGAGVTLTCYENKSNGWSKIEYNGSIGYIKTEYITDSNGDSNIKTHGTVRLSETVKIRKEPSTEAESYGVGYGGQEFDLIESMDNGWTKILFEGKEAYIKSEFIQ